MKNRGSREITEIDGVEATEKEGSKGVKRKEKERDDGREARSQKLATEAGNSTKREAAMLYARACVRACVRAYVQRWYN